MVGSICTWIFRAGAGSPALGAVARVAVHDTKDETWRHLDFFQHRTLLHARVPRVSCPNCGVRKVATPWARAGSGFTLLFEAYVLALAKAMPIANAAKRLGEHDTRLWRIVEHYVWRAVEALDLSQVRLIAADETSARRGHDYISLFVDMARRKVIYAADGKDGATVKEFADFLEAHGGKREAVTDASIDMGAAFEAGIKANFENAQITFDKFHVIKLANEAVDQVRREEARNNFQIKGRRYIFLKNVDHLTLEEKGPFHWKPLPRGCARRAPIQHNGCRTSMAFAIGRGANGRTRSNALSR